MMCESYPATMTKAHVYKCIYNHVSYRYVRATLVSLHVFNFITLPMHMLN